MGKDAGNEEKTNFHRGGLKIGTSGKAGCRRFAQMAADEFLQNPKP
jgi:hypothetical protein